MKKGISTLLFPAGGLNRSTAYQSQPPYTCSDALNVRSSDVFLGRGRGGSRPGLIKSHATQLGSGNPVRMLGTVTYLVSDGLTFWADEFEGTVMGSTWSNAAFFGAALPSVSGSSATLTYGTSAGAMRAAYTALDTAQAYQIEMFLYPYGGQYGGKFQIVLRGTDAAATSSAVTDATFSAVIVELILSTTGASSGTIKVYSAGTPTSYTLSAGTTTVEPGWFSVNVNANTLNVYWRGELLLTQAIAAAAGSRFGFGLNPTSAGCACMVDTYRIQHYTNTSAQVLRRMPVASSNGLLYKETTLGTLAQVSSSLTLASDRLLMCAEKAQKLYIADCGNPLFVGTGGSIGGAAHDELSKATVDFTAANTNKADIVCVLSNVSGSTAGTYTISGATSAHAHLVSAPGDGTADYRIERGPKIYDPIAGTLSLWTATAGQVPTGCPLLAFYRGRAVLAGAPIAPHVWYMSRQDDPLDFDYSDTDAQRAVAGTNTESGALSGPITALIPHSDDYLVFATLTSLWVLRGDPAYGGQIDALSHSVGCIDKKAWCRGPGGEIIFLSRDGLYGLAPGGSSYPQSLSRERLPNELIGVDTTVYTVLLEYSVADRGVHVYLTPLTASTGEKHWFFDWDDKGFWPVTLTGDHEPTAILAYEGQSAIDCGVLLGCRDGYLRRYHDLAARDDGTAFTNYVLLGPIMLGDGYHDGLVNELIGVLGANSGNVTWSVIPGADAETAFNATAVDTGTLVAGYNRTFRPRARGGAFYVKLTGTANRAWAFERMTVLREVLGKQRK